MMHPNPRRVIPVVLLIALIATGVWYFTRPATAENGALAASGTIEATQINVAAELGGRVVAVNVQEGDEVKAGDVLVQFDTTLLEAQRAQAEVALQTAQAALDAAQAAHEAASANYALVKAGPSAEQLAVAKAGVDAAQTTVDGLQAMYDDLPEVAQAAQAGKELKLKLDQARAALATAQAQYDLAEAGPRPEQVDAAQAQMDAAAAQVQVVQGQVDAAQAALNVLDVQIGKLTVTAPSDGVVLSRAFEPGEVASPGAILLVVGQLDNLTITVYAPEDRYGEITLEQTAQVSVDSFPGETFTASVTHIADRAEFTPRNVQTAEGRKTTVFAVRLSISTADGKLKPGMPADVKFGN
jgi:multidrug resistance efflux pump